jgi:uncharacterized membrane protein
MLDAFSNYDPQVVRRTVANDSEATTPVAKEQVMEVCILKFEGTNDADDALEEVSAAEADRKPWLHEVGVVRRPLVGRISIRATFADDQAVEVREGDLASKVADVGGMTGYLMGSLVGPLHADMAAMSGIMRASSGGKVLEKQLLNTDDIKSILPRGSSALVLIATPEINDTMVTLFAKWSPEVIRRDVAQEVQKRLETFQQKVLKDIAQQRAAAP